MTDIITQINRIVESELLEKAIIRVNGFLRQYYWDLQVLDSVAALHYHQGNFLKPDNYGFLKGIKQNARLNA